MALNFPNTPADGDRYEAPNGATYQWNGTYNYWELVGSDGAAKVSISEQPPTALPGQLWWDSAAGELYIYYADTDSAQWVPANAVTTVGTGSNVQAADFLDITTTGINGKSAGRNFVHNGDFRISQRTAGLGVTTSGYYGPDRWYSEISNFPPVNITIDRSDLPTEGGYASAIRCGVVSSSTNAFTTRFCIRQNIEAQDVAELLYGTVKSKQLTASFWIKSSVTGDITVELTSQDDNYSCSGFATVDAANTWQYKTVTFPINLNGTVLTNQPPNSSGISIALWLAAGSSITTDAILLTRTGPKPLVLLPHECLTAISNWVSQTTLRFVSPALS